MINDITYCGRHNCEHRDCERHIAHAPRYVAVSMTMYNCIRYRCKQDENQLVWFDVTEESDWVELPQLYKETEK